MIQRLDDLLQGYGKLLNNRKKNDKIPLQDDESLLAFPNPAEMKAVILVWGEIHEV